MGAGAKAKSVTNNLPILSVLAVRGVFVVVYRNCQGVIIIEECCNCHVLKSSLIIRSCQLFLKLLLLSINYFFEDGLKMLKREGLEGSFAAFGLSYGFV